MPRPLSILSFVAALAMAPAAFAQETTADDTATDSGGDSAFSTGREVPPQESLTYVKETFGDWSLRCFRTEDGNDPCQLYQLLTEEAGNPVAEFTIFDIDDQGGAIAGGTVVVPLFTLLTEELKISVDGSSSKSYPYRVCTESGCVSQIGLTAEDVAAFKRGANATLSLVPAQAPDQIVNINVSLSGFTKGFDAVSIFDE